MFEKKKPKKKGIKKSSDVQGSWIGRSSARPPGERQERSPCGHCEWCDDSVNEKSRNGPDLVLSIIALFGFYFLFGFLVFRLFSLSLERGGKIKPQTAAFIRFAAPCASSRESSFSPLFSKRRKRRKKGKRASLKAPGRFPRSSPLPEREARRGPDSAPAAGIQTWMASCIIGSSERTAKKGFFEEMKKRSSPNEDER